MRFLVVIEKTRTGFSAYAPDLPGCIAAAPTRPRVEAAIARSVRMHLDGMREEGLKVPVPRTWSTHVEVPA
jgi:predicted RNase H-like HicB family nuclease